MNIKLVILDRDGVINEDSDDYIKSPDEWHAIPGSLEAIKKLNDAGYLVAIATNQSGIARGFYNHETLDRIHQKMYQALSERKGHIDALFYCDHHPDDSCSCRKPKPGLLIKIQELFNLPWENILMIGDTLKDLQAAEQAGCSGFLVKTGKGRTACTQIKSGKNLVFENLSQAVDYLLRK